MTLINILFLPAIFFIGLVTSYEDIKYGKIRNKWIMAGIYWGLSALFLLFILKLASPLMKSYSLPVLTMPFSYFWKALLNAALAIIVSFIMWRFNVWTAGDAKLFIVYSLLIPLSYYWRSNLLFFPSFALLINIFFIVFLYFLFCSTFIYAKSILSKKASKEISRDDKAKSSGLKIFLKKLNYFKTNIGMILGLLAIILLFNFFRQPIQKYAPFDINYFQVIIFIVFIIFSGAVNKFFRKSAILKIAALFLIFLLVYGFINNFSATFKTTGLILAMMFIFMAIFGFFQKLINVYFEKAPPATSFSFAGWMFIGVIATLIIKGSLPTLLLNHILGG